MKEISFIKDKRKYLHGVVLAFAALAAGLFLYFYFFYHGPADGTVMVEIPKNATGREIGEMLEEKGVIRSAAVFRAMLLATGNGKALKSGYYTFRQGSTVAETISVLKKMFFRRRGWNAMEIFFMKRKLTRLFHTCTVPRRQR